MNDPVKKLQLNNKYFKQYRTTSSCSLYNSPKRATSTLTMAENAKLFKGNGKKRTIQPGDKNSNDYSDGMLSPSYCLKYDRNKSSAKMYET